MRKSPIETEHTSQIAVVDVFELKDLPWDVEYTLFLTYSTVFLFSSVSIDSMAERRDF